MLWVSIYSFPHLIRESITMRIILFLMAFSIGSAQKILEFDRTIVAPLFSNVTQKK